jgi:hypothetical protein
MLPAAATFTAADAGSRSVTARFVTAGSQTLSATDATGLTARSPVAAVSAGAASQLTLIGPAATVAGAPATFTLAAQDSYGNVASGYTGTVHFTSSDGQAVLPADYTFASQDAGQHGLSAALRTAGIQSITATDTAAGSLTATQNGIAVSPAALSGFAVVGFPSTTAGLAQSFTVKARDAFGNLISGYTGTVSFSSTDAQAVLPASYKFASADAGAHAFTATLKTSGSQAITASDTVSATINGTESGIAVKAAAATSLKVSGFPASVTAGVTGNATVTIYDIYGNIADGYLGTTHFTSSDTSASLPANYAFSASDVGKHTFAVTLKTAGVQSIKVTDTVSPALSATQSGISVAAAAASSLAVTGFPNTAAGAAQSFVVTARDAYSNVVTAYTGTVHFTSSDGLAILPADYTFTTADAGKHTFTATLKTAGTQSITATDTASSGVTGTQTAIKVTPLTATALRVSGFPVPATAGVSSSITVTAIDQFGNTATSYTGTVHFTSSDPKAALSANYKFATADAGKHVFAATLKTAGTQSITSTDTVSGGLTATQSGIVVNAAAAASFSLAGFPVTATAGAAGAVTLTAFDAYGNIAIGYTGTVKANSTDPKAVLPTNYTFVAADAGVHAFTVTLKTAGTQSITLSDIRMTTLSGTQAGIRVTPAAVGALLVTGFPATTAGVAQTFTVTARDAYGNTVPGYLGTVHFTSTDSQAVLPADYTFTTADAGAHTFSATLKTGATQTISATDTASSSVTGAQTGITVKAAAAASLKLTATTTTVTAGTAVSVTVTALDAFGNVAITYLGTVHFTSTDPLAVLPADYTFKSTDAGKHTFTVTLKTAGPQSLTCVDTTAPALAATLGGVTVKAAAANSFRLSGIPAMATAGTAYSLTVTAYDSYGNIATGYLGTLHFTSSDSKALLPANYAFTAGDAGVHVFTVVFNTTGTQSITVADTVVSSLKASQTGITVK